MKPILTAILLILSLPLWAQTGLVLSGGGAAALAHIGVLKALDEKNIVVDNITGTSMGAFIGALYAIGYSAEEIEQMISTDDFQALIKGEILAHPNHYHKQDQVKPAFITWAFDPKYPLEKNIPRFLINSNGVERALNELFLAPEMYMGNAFSELPIPFVCTAALIEDKRSRAFKQGSLIQAIRASLSYPFYFPAFSINDTVYFDGGLYNNFPVQSSCDAFNNERYIGVNVSYNYSNPAEDDLIEQLKNMLVSKTDYSLLGMDGVMISPETESGTFDFSNPKALIDSGYAMAMRALKSWDGDSLAFKKVSEQKHAFRRACEQLQEQKFKSNGQFLKNKNRQNIALKEVPKLLSEFHSDPFIERYYAYSKDSIIRFEKRFEDPFELQLGGNVSSKPINTGFAQLTYRNAEKLPIALHGNIYFGKFYSSAEIGSKLYVYGRLRPYTISLKFTVNQWDYFNSKASFFQEVRPPFVVLSEDFFALEFSRGLGKSGKLSVGLKEGKRNARYYLNNQFSPADTADLSTWRGVVPHAGLDINSQDDLLYPTKGSRIKLDAAYLSGSQRYMPGNTSVLERSFSSRINWFKVNAELSKYYKINKGFLGLGALASVNSNFEFSNFRASQLFSSKFQPIQEMLSFYADDFQANQYIAPRVSFGFSPSTNWQFRNDLYYFQNIIPIEEGINQQSALGPTFPTGKPVNSLTAFYKTPFGRVSVSVNYFSGFSNPVTVLFNFGDILFNQSFL